MLPLSSAPVYRTPSWQRKQHIPRSVSVSVEQYNLTILAYNHTRLLDTGLTHFMWSPTLQYTNAYVFWSWVAFVKWPVRSGIGGVVFANIALSFLRRLLLMRPKILWDFVIIFTTSFYCSRFCASWIRSTSSHSVFLNPVSLFHLHTVNWRVQSHAFLIPPLGATCPIFHQSIFHSH